MEMTPQAVRSTGFKLVKRGYDPDEVEAFKEQVAGAVEFAQNQATAMEARARAAVAKLQEVSQQVQPAAQSAPATSSSGDTEVISRTLLLAQRTADQAVAEARREAENILAGAREEAGRLLDNARSMADKSLAEARSDARRAAEDEKVKADNEVQSLLARRDFLLSDVDHLEQYLQAQRERLRDAAVQIQDLVERVPGGLGEMRRPLLSASAGELPSSVAPTASVASLDPDDDLDDTAETPAPARSAGDVVPTMPSGDDANDEVWRLLDAEITGEMPRPAVPSLPDPFHIEDEELQ